MAISTVSSAASAVQQQMIPNKREQEPVKQSESSRTQSSSQAERPRQAERAQERANQQERVNQQQSAQPPKPVVNAQGQKTGTIINTTA